MEGIYKLHVPYDLAISFFVPLVLLLYSSHGICAEQRNDCTSAAPATIKASQISSWPGIRECTTIS